MTLSSRTGLLAGSALVLTGLLFAQTALAQQATIVLDSAELGATSYNPVTASNLNTATSMIYDRTRSTTRISRPPGRRAPTAWNGCSI